MSFVCLCVVVAAVYMELLLSNNGNHCGGSDPPIGEKRVMVRGAPPLFSTSSPCVAYTRQDPDTRPVENKALPL